MMAWDGPPDFSRFPVTIRGWKLGKRQTIEIHRDRVRVTEKGRFTADSEEEPLSAFRGVLRRTERETRWTGYGTHWQTVHVVELIHPYITKTLQLYKADTDKGIRNIWQAASRALDLPALDETADGTTVTRAPEDLDKSIRDLAAEGKVRHHFDVNAPPPKGISQKRGQGELHFTIRAVKWGKGALSWAIFLGFLLVLSYIGSYIFGWPEEFRQWVGLARPYVLGVIVLILGGSTFADFIASRHIVITRGEVRYFRKSPLGSLSQRAIPHDELKSVRRISTFAGGLGFGPFPVSLGEDHKLVLESDKENISIGRLGEHQLRWLEQFILAATIDAPR